MVQKTQIILVAAQAGSRSTPPIWTCRNGSWPEPHAGQDDLQDTVEAGARTALPAGCAPPSCSVLEDMSEPEIDSALGSQPRDGSPRALGSRARGQTENRRPKLAASRTGPEAPDGRAAMVAPAPACGNISPRDVLRPAQAGQVSAHEEGAVRSTMMECPLTTRRIMRSATSVWRARSRPGTGEGSRRRNLREVAGGPARAGHALRGLARRGDQRGATFLWEQRRAPRAYLAVPSMGASCTPSTN